MDYRIVETEKKQFITRVRAFKNEIMNDTNNREIPDFWAECNNQHLVEKLRQMHSEGKRDLYGLCSPTKANETTFDYGIGVICDSDLKVEINDALLSEGYRIWEVNAGTFAVFKCYGTNGDCISEMWRKFFKEFLPQSGYEQTDETDFEIYYEEGEAELFCELWIPIKKK